MGFPRKRGVNRPRREVTLDLSDKEWDWIAVHAATLGISFIAAVRDALRVAAPQGRDPEVLGMKRQALMEARVAVFGMLREIAVPLFKQFVANPEAFVPVNNRPHPEILASIPQWHEPGNEEMAPYDPYGTPASGVMP